MKGKRSRGFLMAAIVFTLTGCTGLYQYRTDYHTCTCTNGSTEPCLNSTIEDHPAENYSLAFVEFDDQGSLWSRAQLDNVMERINKEGSKKDGLLLVVFIHGWKNNAAYDNDNVMEFRKSLAALAKSEAAASANAEIPVASRRVMGLYVGWRGLSLTDPISKQFTFWDRKNTADRVGHGAVTEFLVKLENEAKRSKSINPNSSLVLVGHSFGGLILYSAVSQIMTERMADPTKTEAFADMVIMLNPAIEAARFTPLQELAATRSYKDGQFPALVILTSKGDWATKVFFKIGRWFSTIFDAYRDDEQSAQNITAVGHYQPYTTHELKLLVKSRSQGAQILERNDVTWEDAAAEHGYVIDFRRVQLIHKYDADHMSDPRNPIMVISADTDIVRDHNDIFNINLRSFLVDLIISKPMD